MTWLTQEERERFRAIAAANGCDMTEQLRRWIADFEPTTGKLTTERDRAANHLAPAWVQVLTTMDNAQIAEALLNDIYKRFFASGKLGTPQAPTPEPAREKTVDELEDEITRMMGM